MFEAIDIKIFLVLSFSQPRKLKMIISTRQYHALSLFKLAPLNHSSPLTRFNFIAKLLNGSRPLELDSGPHSNLLIAPYAPKNAGGLFFCFSAPI